MLYNRVDGDSDSKPLLMERYTVHTIINYHVTCKVMIIIQKQLTFIQIPSQSVRPGLPYSYANVLLQELCL